MPRYEGGVAERDGSYHQGTVWPWLIGPFVEAWLRMRANTNEAKAEARDCPFQAWSIGELIRLESTLLSLKSPLLTACLIRRA